MLSYNSPVGLGATTPKSPVLSLSSISSSPKLAANVDSTIASVASHISTPAAPHPTTRPRLGDCHHIWLVTGPAGCGKTTVAEHIADTLNLPYIEGDSVRALSCVTLSLCSFCTRSSVLVRPC